MQRAKINVPMPKRSLKARQEPGSFVEIRSHAETVFRLPTDDNTPESLRALQAANAHFRTVGGPAPLGYKTHRPASRGGRDRKSVLFGKNLYNGCGGLI